MFWGHHWMEPAVAPTKNRETKIGSRQRCLSSWAVLQHLESARCPRSRAGLQHQAALSSESRKATSILCLLMALGDVLVTAHSGQHERQSRDLSVLGFLLGTGTEDRVCLIFSWGKLPLEGKPWGLAVSQVLLHLVDTGECLHGTQQRECDVQRSWRKLE